MLPYFKKLESSWRGAVPYHGDAGPLPIAPNATTKLLHEPLMATAAAAGYWTCDDINGRLEEGFARTEITVDARGRRASAARAYLKPVRHRPNLEVMQGALTTRVLVEGGRAVGIELRRGAETRQVQAEREVLLCGGTYNSAQLLLLSGTRTGGRPAARGNPPAGRSARRGRESLGAHPRRPAVPNARAGVLPARTARGSRGIFAAALDAVRHRAFAAQVSSCNVVIRTQPSLPQPDIQLMCNPVRMDARVWWPLLSARQAHLLTTDAVLLHPGRGGRVSLRSADPEAKPRIQFNALAEPEDLATLRRGLRAARRIYATAPQSELVEREVFPGTETLSDAELDAFIRANAGSRSIRWVPVPWRPAQGESWMRNCECRASTGCVSSMHRSCHRAGWKYLWRGAHDRRARRRSHPRPQPAAAPGALMTDSSSDDLRANFDVKLVHAFDVRMNFHKRVIFGPVSGGARQGYVSFKDGIVRGPKLNGRSWNTAAPTSRWCAPMAWWSLMRTT